MTQTAPETTPNRYPWVMFATLAFVLITLNLAGLFQLSERARVERQAAAIYEDQVRHGAATYVTNCGRCHGGNGEGTRNLAPAINDIDFLNSVSDDFLRHTIAEGRPRTIMPAWSQSEGGPLTSQEIDEIVAFFRNWQKPAVEMGRTLTASGLRADSVEGGHETFLWYCSECHGDDGSLPSGTQDIVASDPERLSKLTEDDLRQRLLEGGEEMPGFQSLLSPAEVDGLMGYLATWPR